MSKILISVLLLFSLTIPVSSLEIAPPKAPESVEEIMPSDTDSFADALWELLRTGLEKLSPNLKISIKVSATIISAVTLVSLLSALFQEKQKLAELAASIAIAWILLSNSDVMIQLASDTVMQISDYGKLLCSVMTSAVAAQGGVTTAAALYTGTAFFDVILSSLISNLLIPMIYIFLALSAANCALGGDLLKNMGKSIKSMISWLLKTILTVFATYLSITGVVSGTTDVAALKAAKLTISSVIPVVGGILSDTSEAVLVSAGVLKNAAGIYGIITFLALCLEPFLRIGSQYLVLKATAVICGVFGSKSATCLVEDFTSAMGFLLAMTGAVCIMFLISTVCFMRGTGV